MVTCGFDPLRDEVISFVNKLKKQRVNVKHLHFSSNMIHAFMSFAKFNPNEYNELMQGIATFCLENS